MKLHEALFVLNLANSLLYGLVLYVVRDWKDDQRPKTDLGYYFRCASLRFNDFLHLPTSHSVATASVARHFTYRADSLGSEILIPLTFFTLGLFLYSILQMITGTSLRTILLNQVAGVAALFSLPATYVLVLRLTWHSEPLQSSRHISRALLVSSVVITIAVGVFALRIIRGSLSLWISGSLVLLYCLVWLWVSWPEIIVFPLERLFSFNLLIFAFPFSAIAWLVHQRACKSAECAKNMRKSNLRWGLVACFSIIVTFFLWRPPAAHPINALENLDSLLIELSRGPCFGSCPQYKITIHGNGNVEFVGQSGYMEREYPHQSTLTPQQVSRILQVLNNVKFSALEDRAFQWCFDTASVAVSVTADGKSKRVVSDSYCTGMESGVQDRFVHATSEIDAIVGSAKWIVR